MRLPAPRPAPLLRSCLALVLALGWSAVDAQAWDLEARAAGPFRFVAADDLARALGASYAAGPDVFTLRAADGVLTVFAGDPDALWQARGAPAPEEVAAFGPPRLEDDRWFLPEDLLGVLGVRLDGDAALLPDGRRWPLRLPAAPYAGRVGRAEVVELAPAVPALRMFADLEGAPSGISLLAVDLGMLALALPEQQAALDERVRGLSGERVLVVVVSAVAPSRWDGTLGVAQGTTEVPLAPPLEVQVLDGDLDDVRPGAPVTAAVFLPAGFDLRQPLTLTWWGVDGTITLRRRARGSLDAGRAVRGVARGAEARAWPW